MPDDARWRSDCLPRDPAQATNCGRSSAAAPETCTRRTLANAAAQQWIAPSRAENKANSQNPDDKMNEAYRCQVDTRFHNQNASKHQSKNVASAARSLTKSKPKSVFWHETERVHMTARCVIRDLLNRALDTL